MCSSDLALSSTCSVGRGFGLVELSASGVDKASMLARTCARLGVPASRVAAFGDMPNDVSMLSWAGMPRVVANAHPALLALGFPVVPANHESGVGATILDWVAACTSSPPAGRGPATPGHVGAATPARGVRAAASGSASCRCSPGSGSRPRSSAAASCRGAR